MLPKIIIIGGGVIGSLTGLALSKLPLEIIIIEQKSSTILNDGRNFAISAESIKFFEYINLWQELKFFASPIKEIRVIKDSDDFVISFKPEFEEELMGHMIEANNLLKILRENLEKNDKIKILWQEKCEDLIDNNDKINVILASGKIIEGDLILVAEGKYSDIRKKYGIKTNIINHEQIALTFNIAHEKHHNFVGVENFFTSGPIASLPLSNSHESSIIWIEKSNLKSLLLSLDKAEFSSYLQKKIGNRLGKIEIISKIKSFSLETIYADKYYYGKSLFIGDAAHSIHPIAGQGLNLAIRDVKFLEKILREKISLKEKINDEDIFIKYENIRKRDGNAMIMVTYLCNELFLSRSKMIRCAIKLGMKFLEKSHFFKKIFLKYAMGVRKN